MSDEDLGMALTAMAAFDMDETPTDGLEELGEACQHQLQAYAAVERANGKGPYKGSGKGKDKGKGKGKRVMKTQLSIQDRKVRFASLKKNNRWSPKQPPKKRAKKGEQLPEPAAKTKAAPARLEISAVVPLNTHDRRWDQLATIKGASPPDRRHSNRGHQAVLPESGLASMLHGRDSRRGMTLDGAHLVHLSMRGHQHGGSSSP